MIVYTTCFKNLANLPDNIIPISISRYSPKYYQGLVYHDLCPTSDNLLEFKKSNNKQQFIDRFNEETLGLLDIKKVLSDLFNLIQDRSSTVALVCFESPKAFCHRQLVAEWLRNYGITVIEYT